MRFRNSPGSILIACWCALASMIPSPLLAANGPVKPSAAQALPASNAETTASLERARELIKNGEYDAAIETLRGSIRSARSAPAILREAYLLLIKTYVFIGNDLKFRPQGREASNLNYQEAKKLIAECLGVESLRHTRPEPASAYPPEMIAFFNEVRSQRFGSFRVTELKPAAASVLLDDDTLRTLPGDSLLGDIDIEVGAHRVAVMAKGFRSINQEITISPNATLERSYRLSRKRGPGWYAAASGVALAAIAGVFAIGRGSADEPPASAATLPPAPGPPTR
jgi:hypothetical protein